MNSFDNLKVRGKLITMAGVILCLMVVAVGISLYQLSIVNRSVVDLATDTMPSVKILGKINSRVQEIRRAELQSIIAIDRADIDQSEKRIARALSDMNNELKEYEPLVTYPGEKEAYAEIRKNLDAYLAEQKEIMALVKQGKKSEAAVRGRGDSRLFIRATVAALEKDIDLNEKWFDSSFRNEQTVFRNGNVVVIIALVLALLVGVATVLLVSRAITVPLALVMDSLRVLATNNKNNTSLADAIAGGDFDRVVIPMKIPDIGKATQRDDELGWLLGTISDMCGVQAALDDAIGRMTISLRRGREMERSQDWFKGGINELNAIVRGDRPLEALSDEALTFLSTYLKAGVGALYLFEEETQTLRIMANYAFTRRKNLNDTIRLGEGLAGEAAREGKPICLKSIPPDYLAIGSALGEAVPSAVLALPLLYDARLIGVMEFGTFHEFTDLELDFLKQSAEVVAIAVGVNQSQRVNELLQQSQSQEEELRVQQEELQQSNEELEERAQLLEQQREQIQAKNREMEEAGREILRKTRELEQVSAYKSEFLANMSHELRTPLNSLLILSGQLEQNREGNLSPKQVEYAATIKSAGNDLLSLINDILDVSKVESGRLEFVYEDVRPVDLCDQLTGVFRPLADQKGLSFTTVIDEGVGELIGIDPQRTYQVLKNLLSNAIKFTTAGSVTLRVYLPGGGENRLAVPALAFRVTDTGIGIPAAKHELIFQAFQQADGTTSRKFGGTGLGLSISRQLARGMKGDIVIDSEEGRGSAFTLYLPLTPPVTAAPSPVETAHLHPSPSPVPLPAPPAGLPPIADDRDRIAPGERCILIVEDDLSFAKTLMEMVRARRFAAIVATDGVSGAALAEKLLPSAIILDVLLPGMDGWGVMQKLTDNPRTRHIPVHFITCLEERQKALAMGAIGFVTKPVTSKQLDAVFGSIEEAVSRTLRKLLIVEDDKSEATALVALLEERDISIEVAETGAQAIELLSGERFDCVVLDLGLGDMSGYDLLEHIRTLDESRRIPVIIHTGQALNREETERLQRYAESVIIKGALSPERLLNEVTLFLHVMEGSLPPEKQRMIRTALDTETLLAGKKVLLVDDDMRNIFSLSSLLSEKGMLIVEAENGKAALARLEEHPDVNIVLMDIMMPEMDGYQATRLIRQDPRFARLPVIALTAKAMKGDREACLKAGANDYITKPIDMEQLLSLLRVWLYNL